MTRFLTYGIGMIVMGAALVLSVMGWATYDPDTGNLDIHPVNVQEVAAYLVGLIASATAARAWWKGLVGREK
jgi:hypothetical protein